MLWYSDYFGYGCNAVERIIAVYQGLPVMSSLDCPNAVLVSAWRTLNRVLALVLMLSVCGLNGIPLLYFTPSVEVVLV